MLRKIFTLAIAAICGCIAANARMIDIYGRATDADTGEGIRGLQISQYGKLIGNTADGGYFKVHADSDGKLEFESSRFYQHLEVPIEGRLEVNVKLTKDAQRLNEITVTARGRGKQQIMVDADLEQDGNWIKINHGQMEIPKGRYDASSRIIVQPSIYCVTTSQLYYLTPKVIDGPKYAITQERMYDWDKNLDPLMPYQIIKTSDEISHAPGNTVLIRDSIEVPNPHADFLGLAFMSIEDYNKVFYTDTLEFAQGTKNPLRLMQYKLNPVYMTDPEYIPIDQPEYRASGGKMDLIFPVNGTTLDMSLGNNQAEINKLLADLSRFDSDPTYTLKELTISGTASPEGRYDRNRVLANQRMQSAMNLVKTHLSTSVLNRASVNSEADVAPWEDLVALLRQDSKNDEADAVQEILDKYTGMDARSTAISRLPFYRTLLTSEYLPRMRKVEYTLKYEHFRPLTYEETAELYARDPLALTRYNYYSLYTNMEGEERMQVMRNALKAHPDFICAATDLSADMLKRGENPRDIMQPFFKTQEVYSERPNDLRYNMALACLANQEINRADTLIFPLPNEPQYREAQLYIQVLSGVVTDEAIEEISKTSPVNGVMLMLKKRYDVQAWQKSQELGDSATENYVKAMAANRVAQLYNVEDERADDLYIEAERYLKRALELEPKLIETARIDADMVEVLESLQHNEQYTPEEDEQTTTETVETAESNEE